MGVRQETMQHVVAAILHLVMIGVYPVQTRLFY